MDRKAIIVISASVAFIILWMGVIVPKYLTKPLPPQPPKPAATAEATVSGTNAAGTSQVSPSLAASTNAAVPFVAPAATEQTETLTTSDTRYIFTSHGGGIRQIELLTYPETPGHARKFDTNRVATLNTKAPVPVMALIGDASLQGDGIYTLTRTANGMRAEKTLSNGLVVVKEFQPTSNHLFRATARLENRTAQAVAISAQQWVVGTATPVGPVPSSTDMPGAMWFDLAGKPIDTQQSWFDNNSFPGCLFGKSEPRAEFRAGASNVTWVAVHNQFFALAAMPATNAPEVVLHSIKLPVPSLDDLPPNVSTPVAPSGIQAALQYPATTVAAGGVLERDFTFYAGPKKYTVLAEIGGQMGNHLEHVMGFGFWGIVSKVLLIAMNWLHDTLSLSFGLTIIVITFIIKMVFWPLTAASTRSMKRMSSLQPQMKALQEKYKDDPAKMNKKLMEFMKENKVSPLGGCLPMLLQIPVFFGFFTMIRSAVELRGAHFLWVTDLSQPDTLFYIPGLNFPFNLLPLIMGLTMLWQARLTPPSPGMDPTQQKIMKYMPLMFMVFLYNYSAALTLYWTTNNLLTIFQTKVTKMKEPAATATVSVAPAKRK